MKFISRIAVAAAAIAAVAAPAAHAAAGTHSANIEHVLNLPYEADNGTVPNYGTDIEFARIGDREYAFAGSYRNGMQIVDVTDPAKASIVGVYDCGVTQGDVQIFRQADEPGRVFATYTSDTVGDGTSTCYQEAAALGFDARKASGSGRNGTFIVDVTIPTAPTTVSFVEVAQGSHNQTVHPSGNYLYNSNSDLITSVLPAIEIFNISDPRNPSKAGELSLPTRPGLGTESHDITFNKSGSRAYSAALSQGVIIDTTDPAKPTIVHSFEDPAINVWHQTDPYEFVDKDGNKRTFLFAEDEVAGALSTYQCPNGGVHVYDITGARERSPVKVGYWNIDEAYVTDPRTPGGKRCTAHVFDLHEDAQTMTIAFYNGGVRVVDLSGLEGFSLGDRQLVGKGMKQTAFYRFPDSDVWAAKTPRIKRGKAFWLYGNDVARGLDVFRVAGKPKGKGAKARKMRRANRRVPGGRWMTPVQAERLLTKRSLPAGYKMFCLTG